MYLTNKQHDQFRTLLMGFEVPFRSYVAEIITKKYTDNTSFINEIRNKLNIAKTSSIQLIKSLSRKKYTDRDLENDYTLLKNVVENNGNFIVETETDVPFLSLVLLMTYILEDDFEELYNRIGSHSDYVDQASKYGYARNKLSHPRSKTLEDTNLVPVLSFVKDICAVLDDKFFVEKKREDLIALMISLQQYRIDIPFKNNFGEMPDVGSILVCRDHEIQNIKDFVYGRRGDLRKQHSLCIYGHGGVGKTSLVIEAIKQIVGDIVDDTVLNGYSPEYILFFSAKKRQLNIKNESGTVYEEKKKCQFQNDTELFDLIRNTLEIDDFRDFKKEGLVIVDNLESLTPEERENVKDYVSTKTPAEMQFIITSRNSENYETNLKLAGFDSKNGHEFIGEYITENSLELDLTDKEKEELIQISQGNTLVLVLSLRRLSLNLFSFSVLKTEYDSRNAWKKLLEYKRKTVTNAYEVVADFMYQDTFEHLEELFKANIGGFYKVLEVFSVVQNGRVDIGTICMLTEEQYNYIEEVIEVLCNYLIIERHEMQYELNGFAEKYIINRFLPDAETVERLSKSIIDKNREIMKELKSLDDQVAKNVVMAQIMKDWHINTDLDKIAAAKLFRIYGEIKRLCRNQDHLHFESEVETFINDTSKTEGMTAHPYVKYQKARIYQLIRESRMSKENLDDKISKAFEESILEIKRTPQYSGIQQTKTYASLLWIYGQFLNDIKKLNSAIRYLEESIASFEEQKMYVSEYFKCKVFLGGVYLDYYLENRGERLTYLRKARSIDKEMYQSVKNRNKLGKAFSHAKQLNSNLKKYGSY